MTDASTPGRQATPVVDATVPRSARIWNYWLGGTDNFPVDREVGDQILAVYPDIATIACASRAFLGRVVRHLAGEVGIRQFLDIGAGLPTGENTHQIAQRAAPDARIVYVDNDPLVLAHARALLEGTPEGATAYLDADVREPEKIFAAAAETLDFTRPVALMLLGVMGNIMDTDEAYALVRRLVAPLPPGSHIVVNDGSNVIDRAASDEAVRLRSDAGSPYRPRSPEEIARFLDDLDLLEPGVVSTPHWRPDPDPAGLPPMVNSFCGVARKR